MIRPVIQIGDPRLVQPSEVIDPSEIKSPETQNLIQDLIDTCNQDPTGTGGLSAVQIGVLKRVYIVNRIDLHPDRIQATWEALINPEITPLDDSKDMAWEGCLSVGEGAARLFGPVERAEKIKVTYLDRAGEQQTLTAEGYFAHILQHEQDHLDGVLFLRHVKNLDNLWRSDELDRHLEDYGDFPDVLPDPGSR